LRAFRLYVLETRSWVRGVVVLLQVRISSEDNWLEGRASGACCASERSQFVATWISDPGGESVSLGRRSGGHNRAIPELCFWHCCAESVVSLLSFYWSYWIKNICALVSSAGEIFLPCVKGPALILTQFCPWWHE